MISALKNLKPSRRDAIIGLFFAGIGAFGSFLLQDFSEFRTSSREVIKERLSKSDDAQKELLKDLSKLSAKARGKGSVTPDEIKAFKENIKSAYTAGQDVVVAVPRVKSDFEAYGDALIKLQSSVDELKGPTSASSFVEAVSEYAYTKDKFNVRAGSFISNWSCTLLPFTC